MKLPILVGVAVLVAGMATPRDAFACRTTIGDFVWVDSNGNGVQDPGEPGINGVRLTLETLDQKYIDIGGALETVTQNSPVTGEPGWYAFVGVGCEHDYTVRVDASTVPAGYTVTLVGAGGDPERDSNNHAGVTVNFPNLGVHPPPDLSLDFGYVPPCAGAIGDLIWNDLNRNGQQDPGEPGISALVQLGSNSPVLTGSDGAYSFGGLCAGTYTVCVQTPAGYQISPANQGNDLTDSDGLSNGSGKSCAVVTLGVNETNFTIDFGFNQPPVQAPGVGTPGYWKNHPEAWPVTSLVIGGITYSRASILPYMDEDPKDKTTTMFRSLVAARLNVLVGNDDSCVATTIAEADAWMASYGPVGSGVRANTAAWRVGEPLYRVLDNYNNGMLCAPSRD